MAQTDRNAGLVAEAAFKNPCRAATTANITLSGTQTIDGVAVVADDRVLVKDQTDQTENGIYNVSTGSWTRSKDFNGAYDVKKGTVVWVNEGTTNANSFYYVSNADDPTFGTTSITFAAGFPSDASSSQVTATGSSTAITLAARFAYEINVRDLGAVGDGVADDTSAFSTAITNAKTHGDGTFGGARIYCPSGDYLITDELDLFITNDTIQNIHFVGDGGETGEGATRFIFKPTTAKNGIVAKSALSCSFTGIEFIDGNGNINSCILLHAFDDPVFSSYNISFKYCSFRSFSGFTSNNPLVFIKNTAQTLFENCWWSSDSQSVQLGEDTGVDPNTFGNGTAGQTKFVNCLFSGDLVVRNCIETTFINCEFLRKSASFATPLEPTRFIVGGTQRQFNTTFIGCTNLSENDGIAITFWVQGTSGLGLIALNNRFASYKTTWNVNGEGYAQFDGNTYEEPTPGNIAGIVPIVLASTAKKIRIGVEDFSDIQANSFVAVSDSRTAPKWPLIVDERLGSDHTYASVGSFETILSSSVQLEGGLYRITWAARVESAATVDYIFRVTVNAVSQTRVALLDNLASGSNRQYYMSAILALAGTTAAVTIALSSRQASGTASIVSQDDGLDETTFLQVEKITG